MAKLTHTDIAYKIMPTSHRPNVSDIRRSIVQWLDWAVKEALTEEREGKNPELAVIRKELERKRDSLDTEDGEMKKKHKAREEELNLAERDLRGRQAKLDQAEKQLATLVKAFQDYAAWLDGDGAVDENGKRFNALREAYKAFKGAK